MEAKHTPDPTGPWASASKAIQDLHDAAWAPVWGPMYDAIHAPLPSVEDAINFTPHKKE